MLAGRSITDDVRAVASAALVTIGCAGAGPMPAATATARPTPHTLAEQTQNAPETDCAPATAPPAVADDETDPEHTIDDGFEAAAPAQAASAPLPFADIDDAELSARLANDIGALGPMSIGQSHGGVLVAGVQMPAGPNWELVTPSLGWGTQETVDGLVHAIDAVAVRFPGTPKAFIGNISAKNGGHLPPHVSHQSGRDVDLGYYLTEGHRWYATATAANLDRARTWHLVRTLLAESDIDLVLMDLSVQRVLKAYARESGEEPAWLDQVFQVGGKSARPLIFHAKGHATHLHVRFYSPAAQELGRRAYRMLLARHLVAPPTLFITHTTKPGETLSHLALRYKVTAESIRKANGMHGDILRVNKPYKILRTGGTPLPTKLALPARRLPPPVASGSIRTWDGEPCKRAAATETTKPGG